MGFGTRRPKTAKALLAVGSTSLTLAVLEVAARIALGADPGGGKERGEVRLYTEPDPRLGWRKRPGARAVYERREYTVEVVVNGKGLRDPEREYAPRPGTFRVLALGDSFVEGYSVALEDTFCQRLERRLALRSCPVEVLNGGTAAYSTDQEYLFYADEGVKYSPQVVALFFYYNDVYGNKEADFFRAPKPLLDFSGPRPVIANFPVPKPPPPKPEPPPVVRTPPPVALWALFRQRLLRGSPRAFNALASLGLWAPLGGDEPAEEMLVYKRRRSTPLEEGWRQTARILEALEREVESRGSRFLVVYVPSRLEVSDRDWDLTRFNYDMTGERWDRDAPRERLAWIAGKVGFDLLDLTPALRRVQSIFGGPYYVHDGHWNAVGHRVVAEDLERFLRERRWLPACASTSP